MKVCFGSTYINFHLINSFTIFYFNNMNVASLTVAGVHSWASQRLVRLVVGSMQNVSMSSSENKLSRYRDGRFDLHLA